MAITSLKGRLGWLIQSNALGYNSKAGGRSPENIQYYPSSSVMVHKAASVNISPQIDQRRLDKETGGSLYATGSYRVGYNVAGDASLQPRLEDYFGWLLYALTGTILCEHTAGGVTEHAFALPIDQRAGVLPWLTMFKYVPGLSESSDGLEIYEDCKLLSGNINMPAAGLVTADITARGRVAMLTADEHRIDRSQLYFHEFAVATGGTTASLIDTGGGFDDDDFNGMQVLVIHADGESDVATIIDTVAGTHTITFAAMSQAVAAGDRYQVCGGVVDSGITTDGDDTMIEDTTKAWNPDDYDTGYHLVVRTSAGALLRAAVTDNTADVITAAVVGAGPGMQYWLVIDGPDNNFSATVYGGNLNMVELAAGYAEASVNDWVYVDGKGTRRVVEKKVMVRNGISSYCLMIDGEFLSEPVAGDTFVLLLRKLQDASASTATIVDADVFLANDTYNGWYVESYDAQGSKEGPFKILDTIAAETLILFDGALCVAPDDTCSYALFAPDVDITWASYESPVSIPISSEPTASFRGLADPFAGRKLPVRNVSVNLNNTAIGSDQEKLIGAYEDDSITISGVDLSLRYTYRLQNQDMWSRLFSGSDLTALMQTFTAEVFKSDVAITVATAAKIGATDVPFMLETLIPVVSWEPGGAPRLAGDDIIELDISGFAEEPTGDLIPLPSVALAAAATVNCNSGAITSTTFSSNALIAAGIATAAADLDAALRGKLIRTMTGTGAGQIRSIARYIPGAAGGDAGTIFVHRPWLTDPEVGDEVQIELHQGVFVLTNARTAYASDIPPIL